MTSTDGTPREGAAESLAAPAGWSVLIVDDEPEVHAVTRMVLSNVRYRGSTIALHSAYSAAQARAIVDTQDDLALILLDVVMETDDAGLRLCRYVRDELHNVDVQIVLRTGQPGQAPEREVIENYGVNGYFLKTDLTAQRLHSILISSLRTYEYIRASRSGTNTSPAVHERLAAPAHSDACDALLGAIRNDQLTTLVQPQIEIRSGAIVAVELAASWRSREHGDIGSEQLVDLAERAGIVGPFTQWLIRRACELSAAARDVGVDRLRVAVDILPAQWQRGGLLQAANQCMQGSSLPAGCLELELPESSANLELLAAQSLPAQLQAIGVDIAIDHCGVGAAALAQLSRLAPSRLKIDASLVQTLDTDPDSAAVARAVIALAHTLQMSVVAEGVHSREQLEFLLWEECEEAQGEFLCQPMTTEHLLALLRSGSTRIQ